MRRFTQAEVNAILSRAAATSERQIDADGVSLDELLRVGAELGIAPERIRAAAEEQTSRGTSTTGVSDRLVDEVTVPFGHSRGATLAMREVFEGQFGGIATSGQTGADDWLITTPAPNFYGAWTTTSVSGSTRDGRTRLKATTDLTFAKGASLMLANAVTLMGSLVFTVGVAKGRFPVFMLLAVLVFLVVPHLSRLAGLRATARQLRRKHVKALEGMNQAIEADAASSLASVAHQEEGEAGPKQVVGH